MTHPSGLFQDTIFWLLGAAAASNFTHTTNPLNCISSQDLQHWVASTWA